MTYSIQEITAAGFTLNNYQGLGYVASILTFTSAPVTLVGNVVINPTGLTAGQTYDFNVRWNADVTLSTFSVSICGVVMNQADVNQAGTFSCYYDGSAWTVQYFADGTEQPQVYNGVNAVTAATSGTTTWVAGVDKAYQRISGGPTTLVGNLVYTAATAGVKDGTPFQVEIAGGITLSSSNLTVFGKSISEYDALNGGVSVLATFDATANTWRSTLINRTVTLPALNKQAGTTIVANATGSSAAPTALAASADGQVFMRSGGLLVADLIAQANFNANFFGLTLVTTSISNAELLAINTTAKQLVAGPGSANVMTLPIFALLEVAYGSAPFATATTLSIRHVGASNALLTQVGGLAGTNSFTYMFVPVTGTISTSQAIKNVALEVFAPSSNPTSGTGTSVKIHCFYFQPTLS